MIIKIFIGVLILYDAQNCPMDIVMVEFLVQGYVTMVSALPIMASFKTIVTFCLM